MPDPVDIVTIHHEGGGAPSNDVRRFGHGGYCYGIGTTLWERFRAPRDNWATIYFNHRDLTICLSGNRMNYDVTDDDIELINGAFMDCYNRGEVTAHPLVRAHKNSPGSATACPGDRTMDRWDDVEAVCQAGGVEPKPEPAPKRRNGAMQLVRTKSGKGYWVCASDGGVFSFGDALFFGSMGGKHLNAPISGMAAHPSGKGYVLCGEDGGVFAFGDSKFLGGMGDKHLNAPIMDIEYDAEGDGYWLLALDGGVFTFGKTGFYGAPTGKVKYP